MSPKIKENALSNGFSLENGFKHLSFVVRDLGPNQIAYSVIHNSNEWLKDNFGVNISLYYQETALPCISPSFARFHIRDLALATGHVVGTSLDMMKSVARATKARRYWYITDINEILKNLDTAAPLIYDKDIVKILRSVDFVSVLDKEFNTWDYRWPHSMIVKDFDIDELLEITREYS